MSDEEPTQEERIRENLAEYMAHPEAYSLADLEDIFEDADPFDYL